MAKIWSDYNDEILLVASVALTAGFFWICSIARPFTIPLSSLLDWALFVGAVVITYHLVRLISQATIMALGGAVLKSQEPLHEHIGRQAHDD